MSVDLAAHLIQNTSTPQQPVSNYEPFENHTADITFPQKSQAPQFEPPAQEEDSDDDIEIIDEVFNTNNTQGDTQSQVSNEEYSEHQYTDIRHDSRVTDDHHRNDSEESEGQESSQQFSDEEEEEIQGTFDEETSKPNLQKEYGGKIFTPANVNNRQYNDENEEIYDDYDDVLDEDEDIYDQPHNLYSDKTVSNTNNHRNNFNVESDRESESEEKISIHQSDSYSSKDDDAESIYSDEDNGDNDIDDEESLVESSNGNSLQENSTSMINAQASYQTLENISGTGSLTHLAQMAIQNAFPVQDTNMEDNLQSTNIDPSVDEEANDADPDSSREISPQVFKDDIEQEKSESLVGVGLNGTPIKTIQFGGFKIPNVGTPDTSVTFTFGQSFRSPSPEPQQDKDEESTENAENKSNNILSEKESEQQMSNSEIDPTPLDNIEKIEPESVKDEESTTQKPEVEPEKQQEAEKPASAVLNFSNRTWFAPMSQIGVGYTFGQSVASFQPVSEPQPQPLPIEKEVGAVSQIKTKNTTDEHNLGTSIFIFLD